MAQASVSIGVAGALGPAAIARIASATEAAGFHALWVNDTPGGDALAGLAAAAAATESLVLATGVLPLDRRPAAQILRDAAGLPHDRLVLGVGSGGARLGALDLVRSGVAVLRDSGARIQVGALGPKMRRLAATDADGPLLSWLTPDAASVQAVDARALSADVRVSLYVRTALDPTATERLASEAARYAGYPAYAANFARLGIRAHDTVIAPASARDVLARYRAAVDEVVLRAIPPTDELAEHLRFVRRAAELLTV